MNRKLINHDLEFAKDNKKKIPGKFYEFKDSSFIQLRDEGNSGHHKVEIYNAVTNIYEKITFKSE